jgi:hypothetical protein
MQYELSTKVDLNRGENNGLPAVFDVFIKAIPETN